MLLKHLLCQCLLEGFTGAGQKQSGTNFLTKFNSRSEITRSKVTMGFREEEQSDVFSFLKSCAPLDLNLQHQVVWQTGITCMVHHAILTSSKIMMRSSMASSAGCLAYTGDRHYVKYRGRCAAVSMCNYAVNGVSVYRYTDATLSSVGFETS